jgi:hypothetical protein
MVSALSVRFETLTVFVPELNKAGASDEIRHQITNENRAGCWYSYRKSSARPDPYPGAVYEKIDSEEDAAERWSFGGPNVLGCLL